MLQLVAAKNITISIIISLAGTSFTESLVSSVERCGVMVFPVVSILRIQRLVAGCSSILFLFFMPPHHGTFLMSTSCTTKSKFAEIYLGDVYFVL